MPEIVAPTLHIGPLVATTGTFSGAVSMTALTATTGTFSGAVSGITTLATTSNLTVGGTAAITGAVTLSSTLAVASDVIGSAAEWLFRQNTADGADSKAVYITAGGARGSGRGARLDLFGNEHATSPGLLQLFAGDVAGGDLVLGTGGAARVTVARAGGVTLSSTLATALNVTWDLGAAAVVSPTSPNRTLRVKVAGTDYYIAAKTTND